MDPTQPVQTNSQPNTPNVPNIMPNSVISPEHQKPSLNKTLLVLVIILTIIFIASGYILFSINQEKISPETTPQISPSENIKPTTTPMPTPTTIEADNPNNIDVGEIETDLKSIEGDVGSLQ